MIDTATEIFCESDMGGELFFFFLSNGFWIFRWSFCFNTHLAGIMQGQHMQGYFSFAGWGLSTVWFNRTTRIVKPNIRQRYKSRPPDVLEIYQKVVLKWNLENYESPNSLVQQGFFFFFANWIFSGASFSINRLLVCGLAVCWLWERPDRLPVRVNMQTCT